MINIVISKKSIRKPKSYLIDIKDDEDFYVVSPDTARNTNVLMRYGIVTDGKLQIPIGKASATSFNSDGKYVVNRNLPKEERLYLQPYHVVDWHGNDHYGICYHKRLCYVKDFLTPPSIAFSFESNRLFSQPLNKTRDNAVTVCTAINVILEMFGECEIWSKNKTPFLPEIREMNVPWEILRNGTNESTVWDDYLTQITEKQTPTEKNIIRNRHEFLHSLMPDYRVLGTQNFFDYIVYAFEKANMFVFECNGINNATYVFVGNWKEVSQLTKTQILAGNLHHSRIFHTEMWKEKIKNVVFFEKEGA